MISLNDFQGESFDRQISLIYEHGSFVMNIRYYGYKINLYLLGNFYIEVFYNHKKDMIEKIVPLDVSHSRFNFYTDQIRLPATL